MSLFGKFKDRPKKYDHIVSLGYNCEVSFRIGEFLKNIQNKELESYIFNWSFIFEPFKNYIRILNNIDNLLSPENGLEVLPWGMMKDKKYNIAFHPLRQNEIFDEDHNPIPSVVEELAAELRSRISHIEEKTLKLFKSSDSTLFLIKIGYYNDNNDNVEEWFNLMIEIEKFFLENYTSKKFMIAGVMEEKYYSKKWDSLNSKHMKVKTLKEFAHREDTKLGGDIPGWHKILCSLYSV